MLGQHRGFVRYTKGQHKGLGLAVEPPLYVLEKDPAACAIRLGHNEELFTMEVVAGDWNWISIPTLTAPMEFTMKLRYSQKESLPLRSRSPMGGCVSGFGRRSGP